MEGSDRLCHNANRANGEPGNEELLVFSCHKRMNVSVKKYSHSLVVFDYSQFVPHCLLGVRPSTKCNFPPAIISAWSI